MAHFMDLHPLDGTIDIASVAAAWAADNREGPGRETEFLRYWVDEAHQLLYCLVAAPDVSTAQAVHAQVHGLEPVEMWEVATPEAS